MLSLLVLSACGGGGGGGTQSAPAPSIASFSASPATVTAGTPVVLTGAFANGAGMIMPGGLSTASGAEQSVTPSTTTTYTLTVTNAGGIQVSQTATVIVVAAPAVPTIAAPVYATAGSAGLQASVPVQEGDSYAWSISGGSITAGADTNQITFTAANAGTVQLSCVVTNLAGTVSSPGTAVSTIVPAPAVPVISAPATVSAGTPGLVASVPDQPGCTYTWTILGGTIPSGTLGNRITYTAGPSGAVQLACVVTNPAGLASASGSATSTIVAVPAVPVISAPATVSAGTPGLGASVPAQPGCTYTWTIAGGTITAGTGNNQITYTAGPSGAVQLTCVVTNAALASASGSATSTIVAIPAVPVISAPATVSAGTQGLSASVPAQPGCTYTWTIAGGSITAGTGSNQITYTAGQSGAVQLTCMVTNAALASASGSATSAIVAVPAVPVISAPATVSAGTQGLGASVPAQPGCTYTWTITGGTITAGTGSNQITYTAGPSGAVQLACAVTNAAGLASASGSATSAIVPLPVITSFTASASSIAPGGSANLIADFAHGTGVIMPGNVTVTSGSSTPVTPASSTTYTLTVTNTAETAVAQTTTISVVLPPPSISSFTVSPASLGPGGTVTFSSSYANGTAAITAAGSTVPLSGNTDHPTVSTTYTLTVKNAAGAAVTATARAVVGSLATYFGIPSGIGNVDGAGNSARFWGPTSSAMDAAGDVFVVDRFNNTIRWISPSPNFVVTTIAGTPDVAGYSDSAPTLFNDPQGIALDSSGNLYVADTRNSAIRKITINLGKIPPVVSVSTLAAGFTFTGPEGVAVDGAGNVYVADTGSSTIRKITPGGVVTTPFGTAGVTGDSNATGASTFNKPNSVAVDTAGVNLYVSDTGNSLIRWCNLTTGTVVNMAGGPGNNNSNNPTGIPNQPSTPTGSFLPTMGITVDAEGNVYFADSSNQVIRTITGGVVSATTTGVVDTLVGQNTDSGYFDGWGAQFENTSNNSLGGAWFNYPTGVALNPSGSTLVVSDFNNNTIRFVPITFPAPPLGTPVIPRNVQATLTSTIAGSHGHPGYSDVAGIVPILFNGPSGMTVDDLGNVFIADTTNQLIRKISSTGVVSTLAGTFDTVGSSNTGAGTFHSPAAVAVDANPANAATHGNLYVADTGNNAIRLITFTGGVTTVATLAGGTQAGFNQPLGIAVAANGDIYVADSFNSTIRKVTPAGAVSTVAGVALTTGYVDTAPGGPAPLFNVPFGVAVDNSALATAGTIYVADSGNNVIRRISGGVVSTLAGNTSGTAGFTDGIDGTSALFNHPDALAVDPATGYVYVADTYNHAIRMIVPGPGKVTVTTLVGVGTKGEIVPGVLPALLGFPFGIAIAPGLTLGGANPTGSLVIAVADAILTAPF